MQNTPALQAYAHSIAQCMVDVTQGDPEIQSAVWEQLHTWVGEHSTMRVYLAVGNLQNFLAYTTSRLDGFPSHGTAQLSDGWYHGVLVRKPP